MSTDGTSDPKVVTKLPVKTAEPHGADVGRRLRDAREARGMSVAEIASVTKIPVRMLDRLEQGRLGELPGPVFVRGFVLAYARAVGLGAGDAAAAVQAAAPVRAATGGRVAPVSHPRIRSALSRLARNALPSASTPGPGERAQTNPGPTETSQPTDWPARLSHAVAVLGGQRRVTIALAFLLLAALVLTLSIWRAG